MIKKISTNPLKYKIKIAKRHPTTRKQISVSTICNSKAECERAKQALYVRLDQKMNAVTYPTFFEMIDIAMASLNKEDISFKTINNYTCMLKKHTQLWKNRRINSIYTQEIRDLVKENLKDDLTEASKKQLSKALKHVFRIAFEQKILSSNPMPSMKFKFSSKIETCLNFEQIKHFLTSAENYDHEYYPVWNMALYTGMRSGELFALKWKNISIKNKCIKVSEAWNSKDGFKSTKSGHDRIVPIAPPLLKFLKDLKLKRGNEEFVLPRILTWKQGLQAVELRKFLIGINLPAIRFHDLRASWATMLLTDGVEPIKVMKMGGWSDLKTLQIYIRKAGIDIQQATDSLDFGILTSKKKSENVDFLNYKQRGKGNQC